VQLSGEEQPIAEEQNNNEECHMTDQYKCRDNELFSCPDGFYPVCGDLTGWAESQGVLATIEECAQKCTEDSCLGIEYFYQDGNFPKGSCNLNTDWPNAPTWPNQHACYRYNSSSCPAKPNEDEAESEEQPSTGADN